MNCWKCKKLVSEVQVKIGFRAVCPHCDVDLHTCSNCRYYSPGKPNDCIVPGTDPIKDREAMNLCDEFKVKISNLQGINNKKDFNSLFKED